MLALRKRSTQAAAQAREFTTGRAKQLQAQSKYLAHLAAAQGYKAAASAQDMKSHATRLTRRYPLRVVAMIAGLVGLIGFSLVRRNRR